MWNDAYLETKVLSADPIELVQILYEEALASVRNARAHLAGGRIRERSRAVGKAMAIIAELTSSLDVRAVGEIGPNLARLYCYIQEKLADANARQADAPLGEVESLLITLSDAWKPGKPQQHSRLTDSRVEMPVETATRIAGRSCGTPSPSGYGQSWTA